jgi:hypothetical protein
MSLRKKRGENLKFSTPVSDSDCFLLICWGNLLTGNAYLNFYHESLLFLKGFLKSFPIKEESQIV